MSKKFINQRCIHCLEYFKQLTVDHIFPKSWYPDSTPQDMEKWVAPACLKCNNKLGRIESELYKKLAICLNISSKDMAASGVSEKAIQMLIPSFAKDEKSRRRKEADFQKILGELIYTNKIPMGLMKNFGPNNNSNKSTMIRLSIPELLDPFIHKVVRGLEYKLKNRLINVDRKIKTIHPVVDNIIDLELAHLNTFFKINGVEVNRGPGFIIHYAEDKFGSVLYHIIIWGKFETWVAISNV